MSGNQESGPESVQQYAISMLHSVLQSKGIEDGRVQEFIAMCSPTHALFDCSARNGLPSLVKTLSQAARTLPDDRFLQIAERILERHGPASENLRRRLETKT